MDNRIWAQVEAEFAQRRRENEREEQRRRSEIAEKYPELDRLLKERHRMILSSVRGAFSAGTPRDPEALMGQYNEKIAAGLQACGYPEDYLAPVCRCALCGDQGYVYDHSVKKPCACFLQSYQPNRVGCLVKCNHDLANTVLKRIGLAVCKLIFPIDNKGQLPVPRSIPFGDFGLWCPGIFSFGLFVFQ